MASLAPEVGASGIAASGGRPAVAIGPSSRSPRRGSRGRRGVCSLLLSLLERKERWHVWGCRCVGVCWLCQDRAYNHQSEHACVSWHGIVSAPFSHVLSEYAARVDAIVRPVSELGYLIPIYRSTGVTSAMRHRSHAGASYDGRATTFLAAES